MVYAAGTVSFLGAGFFTWRFAVAGSFPVILPPLALPTLFISAAVFVWCKNTLSGRIWSTRVRQAIAYTGKLTLGVYLIHPAILTLLEKLGWFSGRYIGPEASVWIPLQIGLTALASFMLAALLYCIPAARKYLL